MTHEPEMPVDDFILATGRLPGEESTSIAALMDLLPPKFDVVERLKVLVMQPTVRFGINLVQILCQLCDQICYVIGWVEVARLRTLDIVGVRQVLKFSLDQFLELLEGETKAWLKLYQLSDVCDVLIQYLCQVVYLGVAGHPDLSGG